MTVKKKRKYKSTYVVSGFLIRDMLPVQTIEQLKAVSNDDKHSKRKNRS